MKRFVILYFFIFLTTSVFSQNKTKCPQKTKHFIIDSLVKTETHAGMIGGGSSVSYEIYITVKTKKFKGFDSAWAKEQASIISLKLPKGASLKDFKLKKKGKYNYVAKINYQANLTPETYYPTVKTPINCSEELIISYRVGKKKYYLLIKDFKVRESINLP